MNEVFDYLRTKFSKLNSDELLWLIKNELVSYSKTREVAITEITRRGLVNPGYESICDGQVYYNLKSTYLEKFFLPISIRGRFAFGMKCLEKLSDDWDIPMFIYIILLNYCGLLQVQYV
jgi:hypothetical protein